MVKQIKAPKTSSAASALLSRWGGLDSQEERWALLQEKQNEGLVEEILDRHLYERRKDILLDLANMHDSGIDRFKRNWGTRFLRKPSLSDQQVLQLRDELRRVWDPSVSIAEKNAVLDRWLEWRPSRPQGVFSGIGFNPKDYKWQPVLQTGLLIPAFGSLHAQLIQGVLEQYRRLAICHNPGCPVRFFMAKRKDQKYCEQGECTSYAKRNYALGWWKREGNEWRAKRKKSKSKPLKKRKSR